MTPGRRVRFAVLATVLALVAVATQVRVTPVTAAAQLPGPADSVPDSPVSSAWAWILGQRGTGTVVTTPSVVTPAQAYPATWTGAVHGTFTVSGTTPPAVGAAASIAVDRPAGLPDGYAGPVAGHVVVPPAPGRWIVQAYRDTGTGRVQVPVQAAVAADGSFVIDLGAVSAPPAGSWALGLLDAAHAYAPYGTAWPATPAYSGWVVRALVVTDVAYPAGEQPARADGTFSFPASAPGAKVFQLVDSASGAVLAESAPDSGLVRSYAGGTTTSSYDQALAVTTAVALGYDATALTAGLIALQRADGGFVDVVDARNPAGRDGTRWTGNSAVATWALLRRVQTMGSSAAAFAATRQAAVRGLAFLEAQQRSDGLLGAGRSGDGSAPPAWVSTEHDLDGWQALHLGAVVLGDATAAHAATVLAAAVVDRLWDDAAGHFRRGLAPDGAPDDTDALDVSSWGALFLRSTGRPDLAARSLAHTAAFASSDAGTSGFRSYHPQPVFPTAPANVWVEGSAGVALAQLRQGVAADHAATMTALGALQRPDGALPYATTADGPTSMTTDAAVAATSWFVLASVAATGPSIWD